MNHPPKIKRGAPLAERFPIQPNFLSADHTDSELSGKQAAVSAYCSGMLTFESCERLFAAHPAWVEA